MERGEKQEERRETQGKAQHNRKGSDSRNREREREGRGEEENKREGSLWWANA